jgi:hypothetical protein
MNAQILHKCKLAKWQLHLIGKIRPSLSKDCTEKVLHALVTTHMDNCNALLYGANDKSLRKLQGVLNTCAKMIYMKRKYDHVTPLLIELHWLPIKKRIEYKILLMTFNALHGRAPVYIKDMLIPLGSRQTSTRPRRQNQETRLLDPKTNMISCDHAFSKAAPVLWNSLPKDLQATKCPTTFKRELKTWIFKCYLKDENIE